MDETRDYLDHLARRTADVVTCTIESVNDDGTYMVRTIGSRALRRAAPATNDRYKAGERVEVSRPSATRNVIGSDDVIVSRAPREQRGLSGTTPAEERRTTTRATIISVVPDPLEIEEDGDPGTQTFTGLGFDSQPVTYVASHAGGPAPDLTNASAPVTSDTSCVMHVSADVGSPRGDFDAVINGVRARRALRIKRPPPFSPEYGFFVLADSDTDELVSVAPIPAGPDPWTTLDHVLWTRSATLGGTISRIVQISNATFLVFFAGGGGRVATVNVATGAFNLSSTGTHPEPWSPRAQFAVLGDNIYYGSAANAFVEVDIVTGAVQRTLLAAAATPFRGAHYDAAYDSIFTGNKDVVSSQYQIHKIAVGSGTDTPANLITDGTPSSTRWADVITSDATYLYVLVSNENGIDQHAAIRRLTLATMASGTTSSNIEPVADAWDPITTGNGDLYVSDGKLWFPVRVSGDTQSVTGIRNYLGYMVAPGLTGLGYYDSATDHSGVGSVILPSSAGNFGLNTLWRVLRPTTGTPLVTINGVPLSGPVDLAKVVLTTSEIGAESADLGLCWTTV